MSGGLFRWWNGQNKSANHARGAARLGAYRYLSKLITAAPPRNSKTSRNAVAPGRGTTGGTAGKGNSRTTLASHPPCPGCADKDPENPADKEQMPLFPIRMTVALVREALRKARPMIDLEQKVSDAFVSRWRQQPCPLVLGQKRSSCHRFLFAKFGRQTKRIAPPLEGSDGNLTALNIPSSTRPRNASC